MFGPNYDSVKQVVTMPKTPATVTTVLTSTTFLPGVTMAVMPAPTLLLLKFRTPRLVLPRLPVVGTRGLPVLVSLVFYNLALRHPNCPRFFGGFLVFGLFGLFKPLLF